MRFQLEVVRGREAPIRLSWEAPDAQAARQAAAQQGWVVLRVGLEGGPGRGYLAAIRSGVRRATSTSGLAVNVLVLVEQFHALLTAGLSVIEALETLQRGRAGPWSAELSVLTAALKQGQSLSAAMAQQPVFPALLVALVRSAEQTSNLPQALQGFLQHEERAAQVRHLMTSVALYPVLLMLVGGAVIAFLLFYVMPRFARVFESMANLPWTAQLMVDWAALLTAHGPALALMALALAVLGLTFGSVAGVRGRLLMTVLSCRPLAQTMRTYHLARWYRTVGMLVAGGIPLPESLDLAVSVVPVRLRVGARQVGSAMREGMPPSAAFEAGGMATPVATQLVKAGERSGDVGEMLVRAANFHEKEVTKSIDKVMRIVEPVVMTLIGLGVGIIVILMYLPIFELASAIQ